MDGDRGGTETGCLPGENRQTTRQSKNNLLPSCHVAKRAPPAVVLRRLARPLAADPSAGGSVGPSRSQPCPCDTQVEQAWERRNAVGSAKNRAKLKSACLSEPSADRLPSSVFIAVSAELNTTDTTS